MDDLFSQCVGPFGVPGMPSTGHGALIVSGGAEKRQTGQTKSVANRFIEGE